MNKKEAVDTFFIFLVILSAPSITFVRLEVGSFQVPVAVPIMLAYGSLKVAGLCKATEPPVSKPGITVLFFVFFLWSCISCLWAATLDLWLRRIIHLFFDLFFVSIAINLARFTPSSVLNLTKLLTAVMLIPLLIGFQGFFTLDPPFYQFVYEYPRLVGDKNSDGFIILTTLPFALAMFLAPKESAGWRLLGILSAVAGTLAIFLTLSRANIVIAAIIVTAIVILRAALWKVRSSTMIVLIFIAVLLIWSGFSLVHQLLDDASSQLAHRFENEQDLLRWAFIRGSWDLMARSPFIGVGLGNFGPEFRKTDPGLCAELDYSPHNSYLAVWTELGFPGFLLFSCILFWPLFKIAVGFRKMAGCVESQIVYLYLGGAGLSLGLVLSPLTVRMADDFYYWIAFMVNTLIIVALDQSYNQRFRGSFA